MLRVVEMACRQCRPTRIIHGQSILCKPQKIGSQSLSVFIYGVSNPQIPKSFWISLDFSDKKKTLRKMRGVQDFWYLNAKQAAGWHGCSAQCSDGAPAMSWGWIGGNGFLLKCMLHMLGSCFHTLGICAICQQLPFFVHFNPVQHRAPMVPSRFSVPIFVEAS